ncbi:MAG: hypothetical protein VBE63_06510 [Lamprobacter sp.]|uniref:hypothetical protein n=1 Tax=Lamprobacter sp. TaxID=3100796 RepID=UPI002B260975|nr:hypothetical protein [Lamprobacter sp.]MEA3639579.1 hypothetical protein [Lamprobacter sp.]
MNDQLPGKSADALPDRLRYQPFYCEENIWWLCAEPPPAVCLEQVIFIASPCGLCPIAEQRAADADGVAWWDYHCVGLDAERRIWDLDSRLSLPVAASSWLDRSFPQADDWPTPLQPLFRLIPRAAYLQDFRSDRSHMRNADGSWMQPPPPWSCIGFSYSSDPDSSRLDRYRDLSKHEGPGVVLDLAGLRAFCS